MIAITTSNSISVKPGAPGLGPGFRLLGDLGNLVGCLLLTRGGVQGRIGFALGQLAGRENRRSPEGRKLLATHTLTHRNLHSVSFRVISKMQKTRQNDDLRPICWVF